MAIRPAMEAALNDLDLSIQFMERAIQYLSKVKPSKRFVPGGGAFPVSGDAEIYANSSLDRITDAIQKANKARDILLEWLAP